MPKSKVSAAGKLGGTNSRRKGVPNKVTYTDTQLTSATKEEIAKVFPKKKWYRWL